MLSHVFRLIWNRRRANALLIAQIFGAFVVLFGAATVLVRMAIDYRKPLGLQTAHVWRLRIEAGHGAAMPRAQIDEALRQVRALPGVAELTMTGDNTPFGTTTHTGAIYRDERLSPELDYYTVDDQYAATLGLRVREGRWFCPADDAKLHCPIVISRSIRDYLFRPDERAVGALLHDHRTNAPNPLADSVLIGGQPQNDGWYEVVGVADDVRARSELRAAMPSIWMRLPPNDTSRWDGATALARFQPGADTLPRYIVRTVARATPGWRTKLRSLDADRRAVRREALRPVLLLSGAMALLVLNVALVLFGVLWYAIEQRRAEIGLRRALGAPAGLVRAQFVAETLVVTSFGVALGVGLAVQFPLLNAFQTPALVYNFAIALTTALVLGLATLCALYPSWLAARVQPAVALREA